MKTFTTAMSVCLMIALGATGCGQANEAVNDAQKAGNDVVDQGQQQLKNLKLPQVNWDKYGADIQKKIDTLAQNADCSALRQQMGQNEGPVVQYIKVQMKRAGC